MRNRQQKRRDRLYEKNPHCPRCGVLMVLPRDLKGYPDKIKVFPDNMCTIEHIFSRLNPLRGCRFHTTILCNKCNNELCKEEVSALPIEEKHKRSGRPGKFTVLTKEEVEKDRCSAYQYLI